MYIVTNSTYPLTSAKAVATLFNKTTQEPAPSYIKRKNTLTTTGGVGIKVISIFEVEDAKLADGIKDITKNYVQYYEIEGFSYTLEPMLTAEEAIPLLGL